MKIKVMGFVIFFFKIAEVLFICRSYFDKLNVFVYDFMIVTIFIEVI